MEKIYNFRDKNDLLEHIDKGKIIEFSVTYWFKSHERIC